MSTAKKVYHALKSKINARFRPSRFFRMATPEARAALGVETHPGWFDIVDRKGHRKIRISRNHAIYLPHLADCFDYYFGSATPIRISSNGTVFQVIDFSTPRFQEVAGFPDFPILCPSFTEPYETTRQYLDIAKLQEGDVVLDLGCYSGLTSIAFSNEVGPSGKVVAVEADPINFSAAQKNIARHSLLSKIDNVVLMYNAAGAARGVITFAADGTMGAANASIVNDNRGQSFQIESLGLQDIADANGLGKIDLVKIDIEGAELDVLAGAEGFLRRYQPRLIVEPHTVDGEFSEKAVRSILGRYGYRCETILQTGLSWPLVIAVPESR